MNFTQQIVAEIGILNADLNLTANELTAAVADVADIKDDLEAVNKSLNFRVSVYVDFIQISADQAPVVQKEDNAIQINLYLVDSVIGSLFTYPLDKGSIRWIALSNVWTTGARFAFTYDDCHKLFCVSVF